MSKGKMCLILSALIYGIAPMLAKLAYRGGVNGITLTFLRAFLMLPVLAVLVTMRGQSFRLTKKEFTKITALGVVGGALSTISLYLAYDYTATGLATTLHFIYPLIIVIASAMIYREKIAGFKLAAVMLVTVGIFLFIDLNNAAEIIGVVMAVMSGIFYSFYVIYMDHSGLDGMDYAKLTFYMMLIMSVGTLIFGTATHTIDMSEMNGMGWIISAVISFIVTVGAIPLFQLGVRYEGASTAGIISALEPVTTIILGALLLNEAMSIAQYLGGALMICGVVLTEKYG